MGLLGKDSFSWTEPNLVYNDSLSAGAICHNIFLHNDQFEFSGYEPDSFIRSSKQHLVLMTNFCDK